MMHGSGSMRYKNGDVCKCEYENGELVQLTEQIVQNDPMLGSAVSDVVLKGYAGNRNDDGRKEGYGRQLFSNGDIYEGTLVTVTVTVTLKGCFVYGFVLLHATTRGKHKCTYTNAHTQMHIHKADLHLQLHTHVYI